MSDLRDRIAEAVMSMPVDDAVDAAVEEATEQPEDEIVAALDRQLDVLEGTLVALGNLLQLVAMQVGNLRAEVALLSQPQESDGELRSTPLPPTKGVVRTPSGAAIVATVPEETRPPDTCACHDALLVDTPDGPVVVCPNHPADA